jgi:glycolate oxidase iron-sulfur subunit
MTGVGSTEPAESAGGRLPAPERGTTGVGSTEPAESAGGRLPAPERGTRLEHEEPLVEDVLARIADPQLVDACVHCGFCLPTCPTYAPLWQEEMDSPRGRIYLMANLIEGKIPLTDTVVEHFDRCLGCMACVTSCPSGVQYDRLIEDTRAYVETHHTRGPGDRLLRALIFSVFPYPRRMKLALKLAPLGRVLPLPGKLGTLTDLAPPWSSADAPPEVTPAQGPRRGRVGLLTGCVQSVVFGDVNTATARVLAADGWEVVAPPAQRCCGALHLHSGRRDAARTRAEQLVEVFDRAGVDHVVVNAAGCGSTLKEYGHLVGAEAFAASVRDVNELLAEPQATRHPLALSVAFQDSCHLAHAQGITAEPRIALTAIPGLTIAEPAEQAICCGSAGIYNVVEPDAAKELGRRKAEHVLATGADVYASSNPGCLIQVASQLRQLGRPLPTLHPVELVDASLRGLTAAELVGRART